MMCPHHLYERDRSPCFGLNKLVLADMPAKSYAAHLKGKIVFRMLNHWEGDSKSSRTTHEPVNRKQSARRIQIPEHLICI